MTTVSKIRESQGEWKGLNSQRISTGKDETSYPGHQTAFLLRASLFGEVEAKKDKDCSGNLVNLCDISQ